MRRKPELVQRFCLCIAAVLVFTIIVFLTLSSLFKDEMGRRKATRPSQGSIETKKGYLSRLEKKKSRLYSKSFWKIQTKSNIIFKITDSKAFTINLPGKLDQSDEQDGQYVDFGGLKINFFEYEGAKREIFHDFELDENDYRSRLREPDDDVDA